MNEIQRKIQEINKLIKGYENDAKTLRKYGDMQGARMCYREIRKLERILATLESR